MLLLVTSDGAPGLIKAIAQCFPESKRQRRTFNKLQNIRNKLPQEVIDELYPQIRSVFYQTNVEIAKMYAVKIIPRFFDAKSCLKLVYATKARSRQQRRVKMSEYNLVLLRNIKKLYKW
jgi:transposase-like protein